MSEIDLRSRICEAVDTIVEERMKDHQGDYTITCEIIEHLDESVGLYKVKYQNSYFDAYAFDGAIYNPGINVDVVVPNGDFSGTKKISGASNIASPIHKLSRVDEFDAIYQTSENALEGISEKILGNAVNRYEENLFSNIEYNIPINYALKDEDYFVLEADITPENIGNLEGKFDFGIEVELDVFKNYTFSDVFNEDFYITEYNQNEYNSVFGYTEAELAILAADEATRPKYEEIMAKRAIMLRTYFYETKKYVLSIEDFKDNPFLWEDNKSKKVRKIFDISMESTYRLKSAKVFLTRNNEIAENYNIAFSNFKLYTAIKYDDDVFNNYLLRITSNQYKYYNGDKSGSLDLNLEFLIKGLNINFNISSTPYQIYWFQEDASVGLGSEDYSTYGGIGWKCLNSKSATGDDTFIWNSAAPAISIPLKDLGIKERFKVVLIYGDEVRKIVDKAFYSFENINYRTEKGNCTYGLFCYNNDSSFTEGNKVNTFMTLMTNDKLEFQDNFFLKVRKADESIIYQTYWTKSDSAGSYSSINSDIYSDVLGITTKDVNDFTYFVCTVKDSLGNNILTDNIKITNASNDSDSTVVIRNSVSDDKMDKVNPVGSGSFNFNAADGYELGASAIAMGYKGLVNTGIIQNMKSLEDGSDDLISFNNGEEPYDSMMDFKDSCLLPGYSYTICYESNSFYGSWTMLGKIFFKTLTEDPLVYTFSNPNHYTFSTSKYYKLDNFTLTGPVATGVGSAALNMGQATGLGSFASGIISQASGRGSNAQGIGSKATSDSSHAEGFGCVASGEFTHAEGWKTKATTNSAHAEGCNTLADNHYAHAEGNNTKAYGISSHAEGDGTIVTGCGHAEGSNTGSSGYSHAEGLSSKALEEGCHAEGVSSIANGYCSHAEGYMTRANGQYSHSEGIESEAHGFYSHAEGWHSVAVASQSHAEGNQTWAIGSDSHSEGYHTVAFGGDSHAEGVCTCASGHGSHAEGGNSQENINYYRGQYDGIVINIDEQKTSYNDLYNRYTITIKLNNYDPLIYNNRQMIGVYINDRYFFNNSFPYKSGDNYYFTIPNLYGYDKLIMFPNGIHVGDNVFYIYVISVDTYSTNQVGAKGNYSHSEGYDTNAKGDYSHAEGLNTIASGQYSHAENFQTIAYGDGSHAEGYYTIAYGIGSHAEGYLNSSNTYSQTATITINSVSTSSRTMSCTLSKTDSNLQVGRLIQKRSPRKTYYIKVINGKSMTLEYPVGDTPLSTGAMGDYTIIDPKIIAYGNGSHAEGFSTKAIGEYSHAEGYSTTAEGNYSHAEGRGTSTTGQYSHAEGYNTQAKNNAAHAEGYGSVADKNYSHAEGYYTQANNIASHAEGKSTRANGDSSHAEGYSTVADEQCSHAEGYGTKATGGDSHAEGGMTIAGGYDSHAEGYSTEAASDFQHVQGKYNIVDNNNVYADIIGNGTADDARSNAWTVDWDGNAVAAGDVTGHQDDNGTIITHKLSEKVNTADLGDLATINIDGVSSTKVLKGDGTWTSISGLIPTVLWEHTITLNETMAQNYDYLDELITDYDYFEILYTIDSAGTKRKSTGLLDVSSTENIDLEAMQNGVFFNRNITWENIISDDPTKTKFMIDDGGYYATYGTSAITISNTNCVPYKIIGFKTTLIS